LRGRLRLSLPSPYFPPNDDADSINREHVIPVKTVSCVYQPEPGRAQRVRLVEVPRQLPRAEPDGRPVAHEMVAQLVTFLDQAAQ